MVNTEDLHSIKLDIFICSLRLLTRVVLPLLERHVEREALPVTLDERSRRSHRRA